MLQGRLVDQPDQSPGVGVIGKIKIGEKKMGANGKEYPSALDYFRVDAPEQYAKLFREAYGEKPRKLEIVFISDDVTHSCNVQYELRGDKGALFAKGDGETFGVWNQDHWDYRTKAQLEEKYGSLEAWKEGAVKHCGSSKGWEVRLTMRFMLPKIKGLIAEWQLSTHGVASSIKQIVGMFDNTLKSAGSVIMLPFDLKVEMVKGDTHGTAKKFPVLQLFLNVSMDNLLLLREYKEQGGDAWRKGVLTEEKILQLKEG